MLSTICRPSLFISTRSWSEGFAHSPPYLCSLSPRPSITFHRIHYSLLRLQEPKIWHKILRRTNEANILLLFPFDFSDKTHVLSSKIWFWFSLGMQFHRALWSKPETGERAMGRDVSCSHAGKVRVKQASVDRHAAGGEPMLSTISCVIAEQTVEAFNIFLDEIRTLWS